jgi:uncharacterized membrane protein YhaH (DUF805 family)
MDWYLHVLRSYAEFDGRAHRREYWMFVLFNVLFMIGAGIFDNVLGLTIGGARYGVVYTMYGLFVFVPGLAVTVRRLHDSGKSGWMVLIVVIPVVGAIWLLLLLAKQGDSEANQYGPRPKEGAL